ncbi:hypothetical protein DFQ26_004508 [Actinomortierella ambigua]|nr:hypothetical protein DFQ26_004508 [Actinomortierella ambigua]
MNQTPLDISELRRLIGFHSQGRGLKACALVCKAWHRDFQPMVWRILGAPPPGFFRDRAHVDAFYHSVKKNITWVRHIRAEHIDELSILLPILLDNCHSLISIEVWARFTSDMVRWAPLIKQNRGLETVKFTNCCFVEEEPLVLDALAGHSRMRHLALSWPCTPSYLYRILRMCPSIDQLVVSEGAWWNAGNKKPYAGVQGEQDREKEEAEEAAMTTVALRHFEVTECTDYIRVGELLSRTPCLESLVLARPNHWPFRIYQACHRELIPLFLAGQLSRLTHLLLHSSNNMADVMDAIPIRQLRSVVLYSPDNSAIRSVVERQGQSLERIHFYSSDTDPRLATVLFECPRLKEYRVLQAYGYLDIHELLLKPWVCMDLRVLSIPIALSQDSSDTDPLDPSEQTNALAHPSLGRGRPSPLCPKWKVADVLFTGRLRVLTRLYEVNFGDLYAEFTAQTERSGNTGHLK